MNWKFWRTPCVFCKEGNHRICRYTIWADGKCWCKLPKGNADILFKQILKEEIRRLQERHE